MMIKFLQKGILFFLFIFLCLTVLSGCAFKGGSNGGASGKEEYVKGAVPQGFPQLPYYENSKLIESYGLDGKFGASFISEDNVEKIVAFYSSSLPSLLWETTVAESSPSRQVFQIRNDKQQGSIIINVAQDGRMSAITVSVTPRN